VRLEQVSEFIGANLARQAADEQTCARSGSLSSTASAPTGLAFESEIRALSPILTDVGGDEGRSASGSFCEEGLSR
jgi:hypothetical protein